MVAGDIGLPELPLAEELFWASKHQTNLPPTNYMLPDVVIASRLYLKSQIKALSAQSQTMCIPTPILASDLRKLGLPNLPMGPVTNPNILDNPSFKKPLHNDDHQIKSDSSANKFSALYHYGVDDAALNKVLAATALLIDRMPSQSAVDCLMDMPAWMRNIFLARHGVSNVIGVLLAARLEDSGDESLLSRDGIIAAHNKVGPETASFAKGLVLPQLDMRSSPLTRLTTSHVRRQNGISIKNPNIVVDQAPRIGRLKAASLL
jgi:hypothetical protein